MIKYRECQGMITQVEVLRETDMCVWMAKSTFKGDETMEVRNLKISEYESFHDTWDGAKQHMLMRATNRVASARRTLDYEIARMGNIKGMKPPKEQQ